MSVQIENEAFRLEPVAGPDLSMPLLATDDVNLLGRSEDCDIVLADSLVSRHHASLVRRECCWMLTDLGSRHGSLVNDIRLEPEKPVLLSSGDYIRIEPFVFRVDTGAESHTTVPAEDVPILHSATLVQASEQEICALASRRLDLLMDGAASIQKARDEHELADAILELSLSGTGFARGMMILATGDEGEGDVIAVRQLNTPEPGVISYSKSIMRQASAGRVVRLTQAEDSQLGLSIGVLGIHSAVGCPIMMEDVVAAVLYLDSRANETECYPDAVGFCHAVAQLAGISLSAIRRAELQRRQASLEKDLTIARGVQQMLGPADSGTIGNVRYATIMQPGRFVAGDVLDLFESGEGKLVVCFGDVAGQGFGAGILMAAVLSHVRALLTRPNDPADLVRSINRYLSECSTSDVFVTLFVGVYDREAGELRYVDAGHGHWLLRPAGEKPRRGPLPGGPPVGIDPDYPYQSAKLDLAAGDRILFFSDGVIEHRNREGEMFSLARLVEAIGDSGSGQEDVQLAIAALETYIGKIGKDDDTTLASIEIIE